MCWCLSKTTASSLKHSSLPLAFILTPYHKSLRLVTTIRYQWAIYDNNHILPLSHSWQSLTIERLVIIPYHWTTHDNYLPLSGLRQQPLTIEPIKTITCQWSTHDKTITIELFLTTITYHRAIPDTNHYWAICDNIPLPLNNPLPLSYSWQQLLTTEPFTKTITYQRAIHKKTITYQWAIHESNHEWTIHDNNHLSTSHSWQQSLTNESLVSNHYHWATRDNSHSEVSVRFNLQISTLEHQSSPGYLCSN